MLTAEQRPRRIDFFCRFGVSLFSAADTVRFFLSVSQSGHGSLCLLRVESLPKPSIHGKGCASGVWARALLVCSHRFPQILKMVKVVFLSRAMG